jgi:hypothetical protein
MFCESLINNKKYSFEVTLWLQLYKYSRFRGIINSYGQRGVYEIQATLATEISKMKVGRIKKFILIEVYLVYRVVFGTVVLGRTFVTLHNAFYRLKIALLEPKYFQGVARKRKFTKIIIGKGIAHHCVRLLKAVNSPKHTLAPTLQVFKISWNNQFIWTAWRLRDPSHFGEQNFKAKSWQDQKFRF